ncbi:MAG: hypothetical protein LBH17_00070 [Oscillospiraceae bacterium]|nr:hypothetical protein [Oscillospiraceae bacterium]
MKKIISICLAITMAITFPISAIATKGDMASTNTMETIRAVAVNAPSKFEETADWASVTAILQETPLTDIEGNLRAYCFDLENTETNERAYIIVSLNTTEYPVLQYAPTAISPYYESVEEGTSAVYAGAGRYFTTDENGIQSLTTDEAYTANELELIIETSQLSRTSTQGVNSALSAVEDFTGEWAYFASDSTAFNTQSAAVTESEVLIANVVLSGVPNLQWYLGCTPTAMAIAKL